MTRLRLTVHVAAAVWLVTILTSPPLAAAAAGAPTGLYIGPIAGLTTTWHPAPASTALPAGVLLRLRREVPAGGSVTWSGAVETAVQGGWSFAECPLALPGRQVVEAAAVGGDGGVTRASAVFEVQNVPAAAVRLGAVEASVAPVTLDAQDLNASSYRFYRQRSVAALRRVGEDRYRTSVGRPIRLAAAVAPASFAPLVEFHLPAERKLRQTLLGSPALLSFSEPGTYQVLVGSGPDARRIVFEIYRTRITSHAAGRPAIPDGRPVTFSATTEPPGFEEEITWLASTSYGSADPWMGRGPSFTVRFQDTFGRPWAGPRRVQWLGVRADDAAVGQDLKDVLGSADEIVPESDVPPLAPSFSSAAEAAAYVAGRVQQYGLGTPTLFTEPDGSLQIQVDDASDRRAVVPHADGTVTVHPSMLSLVIGGTAGFITVGAATAGTTICFDTVTGCGQFSTAQAAASGPADPPQTVTVCGGDLEQDDYCTRNASEIFKFPPLFPVYIFVGGETEQKEGGYHESWRWCLKFGFIPWACKSSSGTSSYVIANEYFSNKLGPNIFAGSDLGRARNVPEFRFGKWAVGFRGVRGVCGLSAPECEITGVCTNHDTSGSGGRTFAQTSTGTVDGLCSP
ncbi:MAG TPA: hypothetical protein VF121_03595 [Thermoanaerobaculia bacterium]|nr:hypothetical protein [Thermoanaerobaculia bacterium]